LAGQRLSLEALQGEVSAKLAAEASKFARYKIENDRRKHNYVPFIVTLFQVPRGIGRSPFAFWITVVARRSSQRRKHCYRCWTRLKIERSSCGNSVLSVEKRQVHPWLTPVMMMTTMLTCRYGAAV
jgi:Ubiquitin carboxyl-terminal hydrolases